MPEPEQDPLTRPEVRWGVGCLLGGASLLGILVLLIILSFFLSPPPWVGDVLGVLLVLGGVAFAWLVASALGQGRSSRGSNDVVGLDRDGPADSMRRRRQ